MAWKAGDEAVSPVIATIILVAIAVVGAGVLYSSVSRPSTDAVALAITATPPHAHDERTFIVAAATPHLGWDRLSLLLDGRELRYDGALATDGTWCVLGPGDACIPAGAWDASGGVSGGQKMRVHDEGAVSGGTLEIIDVEANMVLARVNLRQ